METTITSQTVPPTYIFIFYIFKVYDTKLKKNIKARTALNEIFQSVMKPIVELNVFIRTLMVIKLFLNSHTQQVFLVNMVFEETKTVNLLSIKRL